MVSRTTFLILLLAVVCLGESEKSLAFTAEDYAAKTAGKGIAKMVALQKEMESIINTLEEIGGIPSGILGEELEDIDSLADRDHERHSKHNEEILRYVSLANYAVDPNLHQSGQEKRWVSMGNVARALRLERTPPFEVRVRVNLVLIGFDGKGNEGLRLSEAELRPWFDSLERKLPHTSVRDGGEIQHGAGNHLLHSSEADPDVLYRYEFHVRELGDEALRPIERVLQLHTRPENEQEPGGGGDLRGRECYVPARQMEALLGDLLRELQLAEEEENNKAASAPHDGGEKNSGRKETGPEDVDGNDIADGLPPPYTLFLLNPDPARLPVGLDGFYGYRRGFSRADLEAVVADDALRSLAELKAQQLAEEAEAPSSNESTLRDAQGEGTSTRCSRPDHKLARGGGASSSASRVASWCDDRARARVWAERVTGQLSSQQSPASAVEVADAILKGHDAVEKQQLIRDIALYGTYLNDETSGSTLPVPSADCLVDAWVAEGPPSPSSSYPNPGGVEQRFMWMDLTAGPFNWGPIVGGEGVKTKTSVPAVPSEGDIKDTVMSASSLHHWGISPPTESQTQMQSQTTTTTTEAAAALGGVNMMEDELLLQALTHRRDGLRVMAVAKRCDAGGGEGIVAICADILRKTDLLDAFFELRGALVEELGAMVGQSIGRGGRGEGTAPAVEVASSMLEGMEEMVALQAKQRTLSQLMLSSLGVRGQGGRGDQGRLGADLTALLEIEATTTEGGGGRGTEAHAVGGAGNVASGLLKPVRGQFSLAKDMFLSELSGIVDRAVRHVITPAVGLPLPVPPELHLLEPWKMSAKGRGRKKASNRTGRQGPGGGQGHGGLSGLHNNVEGGYASHRTTTAPQPPSADGSGARFADHISFVLYAVSDDGPRVNSASQTEDNGAAESLHPIGGLDVGQLKRQLLGFKLGNQEITFTVHTLWLHEDAALAAALAAARRCSASFSLGVQGALQTQKRCFLDSVALQEQLLALRPDFGDAPTRNTKHVPIFLFSTSSDTPLLLDRHYRARSLGHVVLGVQGPHREWKSHFQCSRQEVRWDLRNPLQPLLMAIALHTWGLLPSNMAHAEGGGGGGQDWTWAVGGSPLSAISRGTRFSSIHRDSAHRALILHTVAATRQLVNGAVELLEHTHTRGDNVPRRLPIPLNGGGEGEEGRGRGYGFGIGFGLGLGGDSVTDDAGDTVPLEHAFHNVTSNMLKVTFEWTRVVTHVERMDFDAASLHLNDMLADAISVFNSARLISESFNAAYCETDHGSLGPGGAMGTGGDFANGGTMMRGRRETQGRWMIDSSSVLLLLSIFVLGGLILWLLAGKKKRKAKFN